MISIQEIAYISMVSRIKSYPLQPTLRMHLRYKSIPRILPDQPLIAELTNHCAFCYLAVPARSIRRHCGEQHQGLLLFEAIHREHFHGLVNLGCGKGQCVLCMQQCIDIRNHQCGVLMQVNVLLGQTYDVAHFPIMPVMMRPTSNEPQTTSPLPVAQEIDDSKAQAVEAQAVDRTHVLQQDAPVLALSIVDSAPPKLFKCQTCHNIFLIAMGLYAHHAKYPTHADYRSSTIYHRQAS